MKIKELLSEIERINSNLYPGGKRYLKPGERYMGAGNFAKIPMPSLKKLPGGSDLFYSVSRDGSEVIIRIWDKKNTTHYPEGSIIGMLSLDEPYFKFPIKNTYQVGVITVDEDYRGQSIAKSLYGIAMNILGMTLLAGDSQTPGGRRNWVSLYNIPGVEVMGYVKIDAFDFSINSLPHSQSEIANTLMGELGAINLGEKQGYIYFAFPVKTDAKSKELMSAADTFLSKIYKSSRYDTGLLAHWVG